MKNLYSHCDGNHENIIQVYGKYAQINKACDETENMEEIIENRSKINSKKSQSPPSYHAGNYADLFTISGDLIYDYSSKNTFKEKQKKEFEENSETSIRKTDANILIKNALDENGFKDKDVIQAIATLFKVNMNARDRLLIIQCLQKNNFRDKDVIQAIAKLFKKDMDYKDRMAIINALNENSFKEANVIQAIVKLFKKDMDYNDRMVIIKAVGNSKLTGEGIRKLSFNDDMTVDNLIKTINNAELKN